MNVLPAHKIVRKVCFAILLVICCNSLATATEPISSFVDGLKRRKMHDVAIMYLDQLKTSSLATSEIQKTIPFEQAKLYIDMARQSGDPQVRERYFADATEKLTEYSNSVSGVDQAKAQAQLGSILVEQARTLILRAEKTSDTEKQKAYTEQARKMFDEAKEVFDKNDAFYVKELEAFGKGVINAQKEPAKFQLRQTFRGELVQTRLLSATVVYEKALTFPKDSEQRNTLLKESADLYGDLYEKYRRWLAGLYARFYQARALQEMKDYRTALAYYADLTNQPDEDPAIRTLISKAYFKVGQCLEEQKKYEVGVTTLTPWIEKAKGNQDQTPDRLAVAYQLALLMHLHSEQVTDKNQQRKLVSAAEGLAKKVVQYPNEYQDMARELLKRLGVGNTDGEPQNFLAAFEKAKENFNAMNNKKSKILPLMQENNPDKVPELMKEIQVHHDDAYKYFNTSLSLVDEETDIKEVNLARYYLCYLHWLDKHYYDAAILGEFLARNYPASAGARQGAKIAMAGYLTKYHDKRNEDTAFDEQKIIEIAEYIADKWSGQPEGDEALGTLISFRLMQGNHTDAIEYMNRISPDYADRGKVELKVGTALWSQYIDSLKLPEENRPSEQELENLKTLSQTTLEQGIKRMQASGDKSTTMASAVLSLAQIYLDVSKYDAAVKLLEDPTIGPLTLIKDKSEATSNTLFQQEAFKAALRAYILVRPENSDDKAAMLKKAETIMTQLEDLVRGQDADAGAKLTRIFIALGRQLEDQLELLRKAGNQKEMALVASSFQTFLDRIASRPGNTFASRTWIASTYYNLGIGFRDQPGGTGQAQQYFKKAVKEYNKILSESKKDPAFAPNSDATLAIEMRLAECSRELGDADQAITSLTRVLTEKPLMLDAQIAAAETFQQLGDKEFKSSKRKQPWYYYARVGDVRDEKTRKNIIWGWSRIAKVTANKDKFLNIYHTARYNLTLTRYKQALKTQDATAKKKLLNMAHQELRILWRIDKEMGGQVHKSNYESLLKDIQKTLGQPRVGFKEFDTKEVAAKK